MAWGVLALLLGAVSGFFTSYYTYGLLFYGGQTPPLHLGTYLITGIGTAIAALVGLGTFISSAEENRIDRLKIAGLALLALLGVIAITFVAAGVGGRVAAVSFLLGPGAIGAFIGYLVGAIFLPGIAKP